MSRACLGLVVSLAAVLAADAAAAEAPPTGTGLKDPFARPASARVAAPDHDLKDPWARAPLQDPIAEPSPRSAASPDGLKDPWAPSPRDPNLVDPYNDAPLVDANAAAADLALIDPFAERSTAAASDLIDPFTDTRAAPDPDLLDPFAAKRETAVAPPRSPDLIDPFAPRKPPIQRPRARPPAAR